MRDVSLKEDIQTNAVYNKKHNTNVAKESPRVLAWCLKRTKKLESKPARNLAPGFTVGFFLRLLKNLGKAEISLSIFEVFQVGLRACHLQEKKKIDAKRQTEKVPPPTMPFCLDAAGIYGRSAPSVSSFPISMRMADSTGRAVTPTVTPIAGGRPVGGYTPWITDDTGCGKK